MKIIKEYAGCYRVEGTAITIERWYLGANNAWMICENGYPRHKEPKHRRDYFLKLSEAKAKLKEVEHVG